MKNHLNQKLTVPFRARGTTDTTTQNCQNLQKSSAKLKYHLFNYQPSLVFADSLQAKRGRAVSHHLIPIKMIVYIRDASKVKSFPARSYPANAWEPTRLLQKPHFPSAPLLYSPQSSEKALACFMSFLPRGEGGRMISQPKRAVS